MLNVLLVTAVFDSNFIINRASQAVCPTYPSCLANNGCTWQDPSNGAKFVISCSIDPRGGDMATVLASSYGEWLNACSVTYGCIVASRTGGLNPKGGFCYLKNTIQPAVLNTSMAAAKVTGQPKAKPVELIKTDCKGNISCPLWNNCRYSAGAKGLHQKSFVITCRHDLYSSNLKNISAETLENCIHACAILGACVAASL